MARVQLTLNDLKKTALTRPQAAALKRINGIDLADILARASKREGWTSGQERLAEKWYRGYLWISYLHGKRPVFAIVAEADELWHAHIVYTKRYRRDCQRVFGEFLDHNPVHGIATKRYNANIAQAERWFNLEFKQQFTVGAKPTQAKRSTKSALSAMAAQTKLSTSARGPAIQLLHVCY
jgi:hypothetical protein